MRKQNEVKLINELDQLKSKYQLKQKDLEYSFEKCQELKTKNKLLQAEVYIFLKQIDDRNQVLRVKALEIKLMEKEKEMDKLIDDNRLLYKMAKNDGRELDKMAVLKEKWPEEKQNLRIALEELRVEKYELEMTNTRNLAKLNKKESDIVKLNDTINKLKEELQQYRNTTSRNTLERQNKVLEKTLTKEKLECQKQIERCKKNCDNDISKMEKVYLYIQIVQNSLIEIQRLQQNVEEIKQERDKTKQINKTYFDKLNKFRSKLRLLSTQYNDKTIEQYIKEVDGAESMYDEYY